MGHNHYVRLPDMSLSTEALSSLDHRDLVSQIIMDRLLLFFSSSPLTEGDAGSGPSHLAPDESMEASMEEGLNGGSGPGSLGSLNISFPHQMSISSSTGGSGRDDVQTDKVAFDL